jgi:hypothetical protein
MHFPCPLVLQILLIAFGLSVSPPRALAHEQHTFHLNLDWKNYPTSMGLLNEKEYDTAPSNLKLEQVHVYVRHGESQ